MTARARSLILSVCFVFLAGLAFAWGPHPKITQAAVAALPADDPLHEAVDNHASWLSNASWMGDWAAGGELAGVAGMRTQTRDFLFPVIQPGQGHGVPADDAAVEPIFRRALAALRGENALSAWGRLGVLIHMVEDTGAPPHTIPLYGPNHPTMENWVVAADIGIVPYSPKLLGKTDSAAIAALKERLLELRAFSKKIATELQPLVEADNRKAAEKLELLSANECARAVADALHTLGHLWQNIPLSAGTGELAGVITTPTVKGAEGFTAKIMLEGKPYDTLAGPDGTYVMRGLPPGNYTLWAMGPGSMPASRTVQIKAGESSTGDLALAPSTPRNNLLRNGNFAVSWRREFASSDVWQAPDGWRAPGPKSVAWRSEYFMAKAGEQFSLHIEWKTGAPADASIYVTFSDSGRTQTAALSPGGNNSLVFTVPADMKRYMRRASVTVNAPRGLLEDCSMVAVCPVINE
ncbi:MAG: hypothetical protein HON70_10090 [Lentisphaerae bacterium]|nr:hypothetical protein [Lentisphaerota bacterium]